ncbi:hypothetical protein SAMN00768000_3629 [Sulfobacillus thermosulfidooxidans DSM 9293]|uniref:Uncharacterized protein n=1 Tax=Sulfobacillus thermosulfidooxidans (strain DSM 9293 / VKM B-1269 / AT-1) TaxID=929705 RepID=A0A1W1WP36_SULTA|nr:hypothetical protein [Sulfobacillus thermosulfidooxidans]SMC08071.1 hypothetical protein SAMN00768000_3629 [Sulfobacillus thermosulfidooxidans DSM 9293]
MFSLSSRLVRGLATGSVVVLGLSVYGLTGSYGLPSWPSWAWWLAWIGIVSLGGWGLWYLTTHRS